jgi:ataxia telangiectasia mutated family protein
LGSPASRLIALQVLYFLVDTHWYSFHGEARRDIRRALTNLLDDEDISIQAWTLLGLSSLAARHNTEESILDNDREAEPTGTALQQSAETDWNRIWTYAIRKTSQRTVSRSACHLANAILQYGKVPMSLAIGDIDQTLCTLEIQGPPYPYDSVCAFLTSALRAARTDVRLYARKLEGQVIAWLGRWNALEGVRGKGRMEPSTPSDLLELLREACRFAPVRLASLSIEEVLPDCAIVDRILEENRTAPIRQYLLRGLILDAAVSLKPMSPASPAISANLGFIEGTPKRISQILDDGLTAYISDWSIPPLAEANKKTESPPDRVRRSIDMIVLALSFQGVLELNGVQPDGHCVQQGLRLLALLHESLKSTAYNLSALHLIWRGTHPLIHHKSNAPEIWPIMLSPDVRSGIRQDLLPPSKYGQYYGEGLSGGNESMEELLVTIWRMHSVGKREIKLIGRLELHFVNYVAML